MTQSAWAAKTLPYGARLNAAITEYYLSRDDHCAREESAKHTDASCMQKDTDVVLTEEEKQRNCLSEESRKRVTGICEQKRLIATGGAASRVETGIVLRMHNGSKLIADSAENGDLFYLDYLRDVGAHLLIFSEVESWTYLLAFENGREVVWDFSVPEMIFSPTGKLWTHCSFFDDYGVEYFSCKVETDKTVDASSEDYRYWQNTYTRTRTLYDLRQIPCIQRIEAAKKPVKSVAWKDEKTLMITSGLKCIIHLDRLKRYDDDKTHPSPTR